MKYVVTSSVPTGYQYNSIANLMGGGNVQKNPDGSFFAKVEFDTEQDAKEFLRSRLSVLFNETDMNEDRYDECLSHIDLYGSLYYDAASARIEEIGI